MISAASTYNTLSSPEERATAYTTIIKDGASIPESDRPIKVAEAIKGLSPAPSVSSGSPR